MNTATTQSQSLHCSTVERNDASAKMLSPALKNAQVVKQPKCGIKALIESTERLELEGIALREIVTGKIAYKLHDPLVDGN